MTKYRSLLNTSTAIACSLLIAACGDKKPAASNPANAPVPVNTTTIQPESVVYYDKFPGTMVAMMQVEIRSVAEGYVTGVFFKEGEHVHKGQKLYSIDDSKYKASYSQAEANMRVAQANVEQAQKDADRYTYLSQHDAVAKQIVEHSQTALQNAKSQLAAAKQDLSKSSTDLNYTIIKAPFDGIIGISQVRLGNVVVPGQTLLNTISTGGPIAVDFVVNEKQIPRFLKLQQHKRIEADSLFTLILPDNSQFSYPGKIYAIDRGVNPLTGTLTIRLAFPDPASQLRSGMSCMVRVRNDDTTRQLLVPAKAVVEQMGEYFVYVAKDTLIPVESTDKKETQPASSALHALQRKVTTGTIIGDRIIVKTGLQSGDNVIVDGIQKLHDGSLINTGK